MSIAAPSIPATDAWIASWIEPVEGPDTPAAHRPVYHLVGEVTVEGPVASAFLHATAHGIYEAFVNGTRVGDRELTPGAVISFLHRYVAGLKLLEPGYRRFRVAPRPGGGITSARTYHDCTHGRIEVSWQLDNGAGCLDTTVPAGTHAEVRLPDGTNDVVGPGTHRHRWNASP